MIRQLLRGVGIIALLTGCSLAVQAWGKDGDITPRALQALNAARVTMDRANLDYQMFKSENFNPSYADSMQEHLRTLARQMDRTLSEFEDTEHADALEEAAGHVRRYVTLLQQNYQSIQSEGFEVLAVTDQMMSHKQDAQRLMADVFTKASGQSSIEPRVKEYLDLAFEMQTMAARYVEYASSVSGVAFRDQSEETTVDALAQDFSARLGALKDDGLPPGPATLIQDVRRKWAFIEGSMMNYMQNQVAFLVYRYSNNIVEALLSASRDLIGEEEAPAALPGGALPLPPGIPAAAN